MISFTGRSTFFLLVVLVAILLAVVLVYVVYLSPTGIKAREESDLNERAVGEPEKYITLGGDEVTMDLFSGKLLVVNLWASWSPYTPGDHAVMSEVSRAYSDRVTFRAVNRDEQRETAIAYLDSIGRQEGIEYVVDTTDHLYRTLGGYAMPETIIFNETGNEVSRIRGVLTKENLELLLEENLRNE